MILKVGMEKEDEMNITIGLAKEQPFVADVENIVAVIMAFAKSATQKIKNSSNSEQSEKDLTEKDILNIIAIRLFQNTLSEDEFSTLLTILSSVYDEQDGQDNYTLQW